MEQKKKKKRIERWRDKYRFVILNDNTFEELLTLKLSTMNIFVYGFIFTVLTIVATTMLIAFTPLREYVPGHTSSKMRREAITLSQRADSLEAVLAANQNYIHSINQILSGAPIDSVMQSLENLPDSAEAVPLSAPSAQDSALREWVEEETEFALSLESSEISIPQLITPVTGILTGNFEQSTGHYAVDIAATKNTPVKSCYEGTVVFTDWSSETGHIVIIQHENNLISVYKHNSALLKEMGDFVRSGEAIAIVGNSGENSTGPHLHFELWFEGSAIDPELYINF